MWFSVVWWHAFIHCDYLVVVWACGRCHHMHFLCRDLYPERKVMVRWP